MEDSTMNINEHLFALFTQHVDTRHTAEVFAHANELVIWIVKLQLINAFEHYKCVYTHTNIHKWHIPLKHRITSLSVSLIQLTI